MPKVKRFFLEIKENKIKNKPLIFPPKIKIYLEKKKILILINFFTAKLVKIIFGEIDFCGPIKNGANTSIIRI